MSQTHTPSDFLININDYKKVKLINKGGFGSVYIVENNDGEEFAAKIIDAPPENYNEIFDREIKILMCFQHPTIIKFYGYSLTDFHGDKNVTIIMKLAKHGSLDDLIKKESEFSTPVGYDNTARQKILAGIAYGMKYLHEHRIIHRDLKLNNILLDEDFNPLITDFGISRIYQEEEQIKQSKVCGTYYYMAPEIYTSSKYNSKIDVYSFGIIMYSVIFGRFPYSSKEEKKMKPHLLTNKIIYENYRPEFPFPIKKSLQQLIEECWSQNPNHRPSFDIIFQKLAYGKDDQFYYFCEEEEGNDNYFLDGVDQTELENYLIDITMQEVKEATNGQLSLKPNTIKPQQQGLKILEQNLITTDSSYKFLPSKIEFSCTPSDKTGILFHLKETVETNFDRRYTISLSSRDPYNMLLPNWKNSLFCGDFPNAYVKLALKEAVDLTGILIEGTGRNLMRGYEIFINDSNEPEFSISDDINMRDHSISRQTFCDVIKNCKEIKIKAKGGNWDRAEAQKNFVNIKRIELFTTTHNDGLFDYWRKTQIDPHLYPITIDTTRYTTDEMHIIDTKKIVLTENKDDEFCEVSFINGAVSINGYRLRVKKGKFKMMGWKIIGKTLSDKDVLITDFENKDKEDIHVSDEKEILSHEYVKKVRIIRTLPNIDKTLFLEFLHFELFGDYINI